MPELMTVSVILMEAIPVIVAGAVVYLTTMLITCKASKRC